MVKQIIKEAMEKNPLGLKEAVTEELQKRVTLALEAKMKAVKEEDEDDEDEDEDEDELEEGVIAKSGMYTFLNSDNDESVTVKKGSKVIATGDFDKYADGWFFTVKGQKGQKLFKEPKDVLDFFMKE